jgi:hypothetical protein
MGKEYEIHSITNSAATTSKSRMKIITDEPISQSGEDALHFDTYSIKLAEIIAILLHNLLLAYSVDGGQTPYQ